MMQKSIRLCCMIGVALAAADLFAYCAWSGKAGDGRFDNPANWGISDATALSDPAKCVADCVTQLGGQNTATYTLGGDAYINRYVVDRSNQTLTFDFAPYTATFVGINSTAFGSTTDGNGTRIFVKSGVFSIPETFNGQTYSYAKLALPRGADPTKEKPMHDAAFMADGDLSAGTCGTVVVAKAELVYGTNNCIGARNGGVFKPKVFVLDARNAPSVSNHYTISNGGVWRNYSDTPSAFSITFQGKANGHRIEFVDGGKLEGFNQINVTKSGEGHRLVFSGAATDITLPTAGEASKLDGLSNRIEVVNGAKLQLTDPTGASRSRFWVGGSSGSDGNVIAVSGAGSQLTLPSYGTLLGQGLGCHNGLEVSDGGLATFNSLHIGQSGVISTPANYNYARISDGGRYIDLSEMVVGHGYDGPTHCNRLEIVDNGWVSNNTTIVGWHNTSSSNEVYIARGGTLLSKSAICVGWSANSKNPISVSSRGNRFIVGENGTCVAGGKFSLGNQATSSVTNVAEGGVVQVLAGGTINVGGEFVDYGSNSTIKVSGGTIHVKDVIILPMYNSSNYGLTIEFSGAAPKLCTDSNSRWDSTKKAGSYALSTRRDTVIKFHPPKEGWSEAPLQAMNGHIGLFNTDGRIEFDLSDFLAINGGKGGKLPLADANEAMYDGLVISAANQTLAAQYPGCRVYKDGTKLMLRTPSGKGMTLIYK